MESNPPITRGVSPRPPAGHPRVAPRPPGMQGRPDPRMVRSRSPMPGVRPNIPRAVTPGAPHVQRPVTPGAPRAVTPGPGPGPGAPPVRPVSPRPPARAVSPRPPGMPRAVSPRPPGMPRAVSPRPPMRPRPPPGATGLEGQVANMSVAPPRPQPPMGPARAKRAARAYHQDATAPASSGWNDVMARPPPVAARAPMPPGARPAPAAAAAAAAGAAGVPPPPPAAADDDDPLDHMPVHRNVISPAQLAANRAAMQSMGMAVPPSMAQGAAAAAPAAAAAAAAPMGAAAGAPRPKINPDQIPSPVEAQFTDQQFFNYEFFNTVSRDGVPLSTTSFAALDQGNCSPKFMRLTTYCMPATDEVATTAQLPIAVTVQPFAQLRADETPVPVTHSGEQGPPRCRRCRTYINPWCLFVEGGSKWICNMCGTSTDVAPEYFCNLDMSGRRVDLASRPELTHGVVDFEVPKEYWALQAAIPEPLVGLAPSFAVAETAKLETTSQFQEGVDRFADNLSKGDSLDDSEPSAPARAAARAAKVAGNAALDTLNLGKGQMNLRVPHPLTYLFVLDVSFSAVRCNALHVCTQAILEALYGPADGAAAQGGQPGFGLPPGSRVGIMTFDSALHFYNLDASLEQAQMLVVGDIDEAFVPINDGLLVNPWASRHVIENLLRNLPSLFGNTSASEAALGAAIRGAQAALTTLGGQLNLFVSTIPTVGPGKLKHREDTKLYGTDGEKGLLAPQDAFYRTTGDELAMAGIGTNVFFFPSQYIDVASIAHMAAETGGEIFFHPRFEPVRDGSRVRAEVLRTVLRETAYNISARVRCSQGLRVMRYYGNFHPVGPTDFEAGTWDADKSFTVHVKHEGKLDESHEAYFQAAVLYTSATGMRRVRVATIAVPVSAVLGNVFRYADLDATVSFFAKEAATLAHSRALKDVRNYLTNKCVRILLAYRRNCASSTSPGQLILPESFKLLPLYTLGLIKSKAIKGGSVTSDVRVFFLRLLLGLGVGSTMTLLYPRMVALHQLSDIDGFPIADAPNRSPEIPAPLKTTQLPCCIRPSFLRMEAHGAYLLDNGEWCLLWLGAAVSPHLLEDLYGVSSLDELDPRMTSLPKLPTKLSQQVRAIVDAYAAQRCKPTLQVIMARQNRDGMEVEFANNLVEDQNNDAMCYVDYLCHVHRVITNDIGSAREESTTSSFWRAFR